MKISKSRKMQRHSKERMNRELVYMVHRENRQLHVSIYGKQTQKLKNKKPLKTTNTKIVHVNYPHNPKIQNRRKKKLKNKKKKANLELSNEL